MVIKDASHLLFIEPTHPPTAPMIDEITRKLTAAWRVRQTGEMRYRGQHTCTADDGAMSDNADHWVGGLETNSLCIHYVACHRAEVPQAELDRIASFDLGEVEPTAEEVRGDWRAMDSGEDEAMRRWRLAQPNRARPEALLRSAYQDHPLDTDARHHAIRQAEEAAVAAGYSPRPDYTVGMGVNRALHEDK